MTSERVLQDVTAGREVDIAEVDEQMRQLLTDFAGALYRLPGTSSSDPDPDHLPFTELMTAMTTAVREVLLLPATRERAEAPGILLPAARELHRNVNTYLIQRTESLTGTHVHSVMARTSLPDR
ncbi:hypothetical protein [Streptomyces sp. Ac-502]|uniref:hypothetical protein n=1 Tax=Streptomyces sp. Ac-502 TaxID=3342801 RepID=UPI00386236A9